MSSPTPHPLDARVETLIVPRTRDLGDGFEVRRALPSTERRMVGPFIFFDQIGPSTFAAGRGLDVRPHPHIGLATVTYLFEGALLHRDSLGVVQRIVPGEVNWMTAGRGIVHSERSPADTREHGGRLAGIQIWLALPRAHEETAPKFHHTGSEELPTLTEEGRRLRVILGNFEGARSPVPTLSEALYVDAVLDEGATLRIPTEHEERGLYVVSGSVCVGALNLEAGQLAVLKPRAEVFLSVRSPTRLMVFGGEPMDGPRHIWWNFVSSSKDRIEQAKQDWRSGNFPPVPDETEFIPLPQPDPREETVRYP